MNLDGLRNAAAVPELPGGRYVLGERIGRGGMGDVYCAHDLELGRDVAIKVLNAADAADPLCARLAREARILGRLDHPAVVPVHELGAATDGRPFYVMKLVEGERADRYAARTTDAEGRSPDVRVVVRLAVRVAEAAAFAHTKGVVHRDIKPANVMVGAFGAVYVLDWGVAKAAGFDEPGAPDAHAASSSRGSGPSGSVATAAGCVIGTPGFMAPEQARGDSAAVDQRTDVFGIGAMLSALVPSPPRPLASILACAMAGRPDDRYASAEDLAADLGRFLDGAKPAAHRETLGERCGRLVGKHRVLLGLFGAYLVMRALIMIFAPP